MSDVGGQGPRGQAKMTMTVRATAGFELTTIVGVVRLVNSVGLGGRCDGDDVRCAICDVWHAAAPFEMGTVVGAFCGTHSLHSKSSSTLTHTALGVDISVRIHGSSKVTSTYLPTYLHVYLLTECRATHSSAPMAGP